MILLAIDTSANLCAAALYDCSAGKVLAAKSQDIGRGHAERLMGLLAETLAEANLNYRDINKIAATCGPGSFTGIRVGLATARGLALGLGVTVTGVNVLEAIAFEHTSGDGETPIVVALDAKRGEVFMQSFSAYGNHLSPPLAMPVERIMEHLPDMPVRIAGSASAIVAASITDGSSSRLCEIVSGQSAADIGAIVKLAASSVENQSKPTPLYLRSADAKPQNDFALKRTAG